MVKQIIKGLLEAKVKVNKSYELLPHVELKDNAQEIIDKIQETQELLNELVDLIGSVEGQ